MAAGAMLLALLRREDAQAEHVVFHRLEGGEHRLAVGRDRLVVIVACLAILVERRAAVE